MNFQDIQSVDFHLFKYIGIIQGDKRKQCYMVVTNLLRIILYIRIGFKWLKNFVRSFNTYVSIEYI